MYVWFTAHFQAYFDPAVKTTCQSVSHVQAKGGTPTGKLIVQWILGKNYLNKDP